MKAFRSALLSVSRNSQVNFRIAMAVPGAILVCSLAIALYYLGKPEAVTGSFAATGLSFAVASRFALRSWKEKVNSDLMLAVASILPPEELSRLALGIRSELEKGMSQ